MGDCNSQVCSEHNKFMETMYELKADQKYMKETIDRIEETLEKFINTSEVNTRKIATEVAKGLISDYDSNVKKERLAERKFTWQKFTWTAAFIVSIIMNILTAIQQFGH